MGWFASFWRDAPMPTSSAQLVACPPFITDFRNYAAVDIQTAHSFFWEFNNDGTGLRFLVFLGRSEVRFPHSGEAIYICDDRTQYRNSGAITIAAIDMLVSCSVGTVTYRRGERFDNLYCPHRFARMFNCDQHIPNILMIAAQGTHSLDFNSYLHNNSREESQQLLQRRHLSFRRPKGHSFSVQPLTQRSGRTLDYIKWCSEAFNFLRDPSSFWSRTRGSEQIRAALDPYESGKCSFFYNIIPVITIILSQTHFNSEITAYLFSSLSNRTCPFLSPFFNNQFCFYLFPEVHMYMFSIVEKPAPNTHAACSTNKKLSRQRRVNHGKILIISKCAQFLHLRIFHVDHHSFLKRKHNISIRPQQMLIFLAEDQTCRVILFASCPSSTC